MARGGSRKVDVWDGQPFVERALLALDMNIIICSCRAHDHARVPKFVCAPCQRCRARHRELERRNLRIHDLRVKPVRKHTLS